MKEDSGICFYCKKAVHDLRPYGPGGSLICFPCMKENPEREELAKQQMKLYIQSMGTAVVVGLENGPVPLNEALEVLNNTPGGEMIAVTVILMDNK